MVHNIFLEPQIILLIVSIKCATVNVPHYLILLNCRPCTLAFSFSSLQIAPRLSKCIYKFVRLSLLERSSNSCLLEIYCLVWAVGCHKVIEISYFFCTKNDCMYQSNVYHVNWFQVCIRQTIQPLRISADCRHDSQRKLKLKHNIVAAGHGTPYKVE